MARSCAWILALVAGLLARGAGATTVDRIELYPTFPVFYAYDDGRELQYLYFPGPLHLSDGSVTTLGAGSVQLTAPNLLRTEIQGSLQTLTFRPELGRPYVTSIESLVPGLGWFDVELDFLSLRIEGEIGQGTGLLIGSARLDSDLGVVHTSAPSGTTLPITGAVQLRDGALFGPALWRADFSFYLTGEITFVPEPASLPLLGLGIFSVALHARRRYRPTRSAL